jgi:iron complex outermembrane receptor protein
MLRRFLPGTQIRQDLDWTKMETEIPMVKTKKFDGNTMKVGVNYGSKIGKEWRICKSYIRIFYQKKNTSSWFDFRKGFGEAEIKV